MAPGTSRGPDFPAGSLGLHARHCQAMHGLPQHQHRSPCKEPLTAGHSDTWRDGVHGMGATWQQQEAALIKNVDPAFSVGLLCPIQPGSWAPQLQNPSQHASSNGNGRGLSSSPEQQPILKGETGRPKSRSSTRQLRGVATSFSERQERDPTTAVLDRLSSNVSCFSEGSGAPAAFPFPEHVARGQSCTSLPLGPAAGRGRQATCVRSPRESSQAIGRSIEDSLAAELSPSPEQETPRDPSLQQRNSATRGVCLPAAPAVTQSFQVSITPVTSGAESGEAPHTRRLQTPERKPSRRGQRREMASPLTLPLEDSETSCNASKDRGTKKGTSANERGGGICLNAVSTMRMCSALDRYQRHIDSITLVVGPCTEDALGAQLVRLVLCVDNGLLPLVPEDDTDEGLVRLSL